MVNCIEVLVVPAHQSVHIEALPAHEQQQAVDASVKRLGAAKAGQQLVAKDGQAVLVVVHHADQQFVAYACLWRAVGDAVHRCLGLQHHLAVNQILHAQMDTHTRIGGLQAAPRLDAAGTDGQVIGRITVLQQMQMSQLGVRQQREHIVVNVLRRNGQHLRPVSKWSVNSCPNCFVSEHTHLQVEEETHVHDGTVHGGHIHQVQHAHLGAATADDLVEQVIRLEALEHKIDQLQCMQICETQQQLLETL